MSIFIFICDNTLPGQCLNVHFVSSVGENIELEDGDFVRNFPMGLGHVREDRSGRRVPCRRRL